MMASTEMTTSQVSGSLVGPTGETTWENGKRENLMAMVPTPTPRASLGRATGTRDDGMTKAHGGRREREAFRRGPMTTRRRLSPPKPSTRTRTIEACAGRARCRRGEAEVEPTVDRRQAAIPPHGSFCSCRGTCFRLSVFFKHEAFLSSTCCSALRTERPPLPFFFRAACPCRPRVEHESRAR